MAPLNSFDADETIDESSGVFGTFPAPDEPLFFGCLPVWTPPLFDSGVDISEDYFKTESLPSLPQATSASVPLLPRPGEEMQDQSTEITKVPSPTPPNECLQLRDLAAEPARLSPMSSPEPPQVTRRKRKKSVADVDAGGGDEYYGSPDWLSDERTVTGKKTAHNMIEKRYRTNLNQKIAALRDVVPSLRVTSKNSKGEEVRGEDLHGLTPAHKLNKATVLSKATEYIGHLERRNRTLAQENSALKARIDAFEIMVIARQGTGGSKQSAALKYQQSRAW